MPITEQHRKEDLGQAYVRAVIAGAGYNFGKDEHDYGIDGTIKEVRNINGRYRPTGIGINYQLKSSCDVILQDDFVVYDLESKNYNDLVTNTMTFPNILILFVLPTDSREWLTITEDEMIIRKCAWWCSLRGKPSTENSTTKRIQIPRNQIFSSETLIELMEKAKRGEYL